MAQYRVVLTDRRLPDLTPIREVLAEVGAVLEEGHATTEEEVIALTREADAVLNIRAPVTARVIDQMQRCRIIVRVGIGVDTVDLAAATRRGIPVANVPDYCIDEVADHALALLMLWARRLLAFTEAARKGVWDLKQIGVQMPPRLRGQTLGLVGFGRIGRSLATKARALGLNVLVADPYLEASAVAREGCELVDLEALVRASDYISIHCALTAETRGLFGEAVFQRMKPTALLINVSRGAIVDRQALIRALEEGWIAGAALDVFDVEPLPADDPLLKAPNLIATPHVAFYSTGALQDLPARAAQEVARVLAGKPPLNVVNPEALRGKTDRG